MEAAAGLHAGFLFASWASPRFRVPKRAAYSRTACRVRHQCERCIRDNFVKPLAGGDNRATMTRMPQLQPLPVFINEAAGADRGLICGYELTTTEKPREIS